MEIDGLINQAVISRVAIAVEKLSRRRRRKKRDASTNQTDSFSRQSQTSTPGFTANQQSSKELSDYSDIQNV